MKVIRFAKNGKTAYGVLEGERVKVLAGLPYDKLVYSGQEIAFTEAKLLAPCVPQNIVAVGLNYVKHSIEFGMEQTPEPLLFSKPVSAVIGPGDKIVKPRDCRRLDYEAELAVVIGRRCREISIEEAGDYIFGYTCLNDVTARDIQKRDNQWLRAKGFYTFCPIGPWIETELDPANLGIKAILNGKLVQADRTSSTMFSVPFLISYISGFMELHAGDVIATGTPGGIGPMEGGDEIRITVEGIGELVNTIQVSDGR